MTDSEFLAPLVHIGYAKAGSTTIQTVFGDPDSGFLPHSGVRVRRSSEVKNPRVADYLVQCHDFEFDAAHVRDLVHQEFTEIRRTGRVPVVSSERLAGHWISGGQDSRNIADRIKAVWPDARILVVVREQRAMINSVYRQYVKKGGGRSLEQLLNPEGHGHGRRPGFSLRFFKYEQLVRYYQHLFGTESVLALPLEMLTGSPPDFFDRVFTFAGAKNARKFGESSSRENVGIEPYTAARKRLLNVFLEKDNINDYSVWCTSVTRRLAGLLLKLTRMTATAGAYRAARIKLSDEIEAATAGYYDHSNQDLELLMRMDLGSYGYAVAKPRTAAA